MAKGYYQDHYKLKKARLLKIKESGGKCELCGKPGKVIHHIDGNKDNHAEENLTLLCSTCHGICHAGDDNGKGREYASRYRRMYGKSQKELADMTSLKPSQIQALDSVDMLRDYLAKNNFQEFLLSP